MIKKISFPVFLLIYVVTFSQKEFQGKAIYASKTTISLDSWGKKNEQLSDQIKKQIAQRMKSALEKTFILAFDKSTSIYKEDEKLGLPMATGGGIKIVGAIRGGGVKYKNIKDKLALEATELFGKKFLIHDQMEQPEWTLGNETKVIGDYTCYKATMTKKTTALDWSTMRRRNANKKTDSTKVAKIMEEVEMPKEILVTAWYTPQIPISNGPGEYWGLPGLILEVSHGKTTVLCTEIILNPTEKIKITAPTKGKKITREEYNKTLKEKMEEMRGMFRNRRKGNLSIRF